MSPLIDNGVMYFLALGAGHEANKLNSSEREIWGLQIERTLIRSQVMQLIRKKSKYSGKGTSYSFQLQINGVLCALPL